VGGRRVGVGGSGAVRSADGGADEALDRFLAPLPDDALPALVADVGGHDLAAIARAFEEAEAPRSGPCVILADTIKGWGLPFAADPMNHGALVTAGQLEELGGRLGIARGDEWARFPDDSAEAALIRRAPLFAPPPSREAPVEIPADLEESYPPEASSQEAFGRALGRL